MNDRLLRAARREPVDVTPIWMMRQAGRSLPSYRELKKKHHFLDLIKSADLIAEISLMPLQYLDVDALIMFADITLPLASLGIRFDIVENVGPVIEDPLRSLKQVDALDQIPITETVPTVLEAITNVRRDVEGKLPLIGFSGAPFTLASYVIEGRPSRDYSLVKGFMYTDPQAWDRLMTRLAEMIIEYLSEQVTAGVQALQLFDSWVGVLSPLDYERHVLPYTMKIFESISHLEVPRIHFGTGTSSLLELMAAPPCEVIGLDWRTNLDEAWDRVGHDKAVQGNLEPAVLLGPPELVRERATDILERAGGRPGHIFNLGHGVLPDTPLDNLKLLVDTVHSYKGDR